MGHNLFKIVFDNEDDLETILEGQPWLLRKLLIVFGRLNGPTERSKVKLC